MYHSETEEQDEHDDPPLPATTSNTRRSFPVPKYEDRHSEPEPTSDSKLPGHVKDDKSPGSGREHQGIGETEFDRKKRHIEKKTLLSELPSGPIGYSGRFGSRPDESSGGRFDFGPDTSSTGPNPEQTGTEKMSPESEYHFDFRPDISSEGSNPADHEPIPNERNEGYPKFCIDEFEDLNDTMKAYVRYRIAGGLMKFKESDTGNELHYAYFPGIQLYPFGVWTEVCPYHRQKKIEKERRIEEKIN